MIFYVGVSTTIIPAQTNSLNDLPKQLYSHGSAVMNTLQQIAGAAGTQFTFGAIVIVAEIGLLLAFFVKRPANHSTS
ncbi:hypothetical protein [Lysinibacillus sp. NPDC093688]|uniref:hypothetical protein n=1 Tax=Lysinibacillus sp. NPDC093688 TaxID=3390577 RepID=UPI003D015EB9